MSGNNFECLKGMILGKNNITDSLILGDDIILKENDKIVLSKNQIKLISFLNEFRNDFFLVGGTAIALHLGHRKSIDFDMFTFSKILKPSEILKALEKHNLIKSTNVEDLDNLRKLQLFGQDKGQPEYILNINGVQIQFVFINFVVYENHGYNFSINTIMFNTIKSLDIYQLVGMKMFALIYRNKWKDIIDLYIIFNTINISLNEAFSIAEKMYGEMFDRNHVIDRIFENSWNKTESIEFIGDFKKYKKIDEKNIFLYFNELINKIDK